MDDLYAWAKNGIATTPPPNASPQPLAGMLGTRIQLRFRDPHAAAAGNLASPGYGEIGSSDPANAAYSRRVIFRALWTSPTFNLRPELRNNGAVGQLGAPINRAGSLGQGARLILRMERGDVGTYSNNYNYNARDDGSIVDTQDRNIFPVGAPYSISTAIHAAPIVGDGLTSQVLTFAPPANPIQFWRLTLVVDIIADATQATPTPAPHFITFWAG
jgi:hypothetical protein